MAAGRDSPGRVAARGRRTPVVRRRTGTTPARAEDVVAEHRTLHQADCRVPDGLPKIRWWIIGRWRSTLASEFDRWSLRPEERPARSTRNALPDALGATVVDIGRFIMTCHFAIFRTTKPFQIREGTGRQGCLTGHIREVTDSSPVVPAPEFPRRSNKTYSGSGLRQDCRGPYSCGGSVALAHPGRPSKGGAQRRGKGETKRVPLRIPLWYGHPGFPGRAAGPGMKTDRSARQ